MVQTNSKENNNLFQLSNLEFCSFNTKTSQGLVLSFVSYRDKENFKILINCVFILFDYSLSVIKLIAVQVDKLLFPSAVNLSVHLFILFIFSNKKCLNDFSNFVLSVSAIKQLIICQLFDLLI